jgi:hypothetical protein
MPSRHDSRDAVEHATELISGRLGISRTAARRLIVHRGFETGRFVGEIATDVLAGRMSLS